MKNILKVLAVALLASSMLFVSCKKEENTDNGDNNSTTGNNGTVTVTLNGHSWNGNDFYADATYLSDDKLIIAASKDYQQDIPYVQGFLGATANNNYSSADGYAIGYFENENDYDANGYGNWQVTAGTQEVTAIDLNAKSVSANVSQVMKNDATNQSDIAMTVKMKNAVWTVLDLAKKGGRK